jgi:hypothetical protein
MTSGEANHPPSPDIVKHRWHRCLDIRWITAGVVTLAIAFLLWGLFGPEPAIRVSRETTFLTEPLAADGLPDYPAAVLAMAGPAPPPEENAAVALLKVCWPMGIEAADLPAVCAALGIPHAPPADPLREPHEDSASKVTREAFDTSTERPWKSHHFPELAAWLSETEDTIDALGEASERPRYWLPSPTLLGGSSTMLLNLAFPDVLAMRDVGRILMSRAMWHGSERRVSEAWRDARAMLRLSRLLSSQQDGRQFLMKWLVASRMEQAAHDVLVHAVLPCAPGTPGLLDEIREEIDELEHSSIVADCVRLERLGAIDCLLSIGPRNRGGRAAGIAHAHDLDELGLLLSTSLDWNVVLKQVNQHYDSIEAALRTPDRALQQATLKSHDDALLAEAKSWSRMDSIPMLVFNRGSRSVACARHANLLLTPAFSACVVAEHRSRARLVLSRTAIALATWRSDQSDEDHPYPEQLADLVPRYLAAVPVDPFSSKSLVYERRGDGYVLASVGVNAVFDGGDDEDGWIIDGEWRDHSRDVAWDASDLVIRMPVPERPFIPPTAP